MRRNLWAAAVAAVIGLGVSAGVVYSQDGGGEPGAGEAPAGGEAAGGEAGGEMGGVSEEDMAAWMKYMTPGPAHERMAAMAGTWDVKGRFWMEAGGPATESDGTAKFRMILGGRIQVQEFNGTMMNQPYEGFGVSGYDNGTHQYFGTWSDSMGTGMMSFSGAADAEGRVLSSGAWTDPGGKFYRVRTEFEFKGADEFRMDMYMSGPDHPVEYKMMELNYTRQK